MRVLISKYSVRIIAAYGPILRTTTFVLLYPYFKRRARCFALNQCIVYSIRASYINNFLTQPLCQETSFCMFGSVRSGLITRATALCWAERMLPQQRNRGSDGLSRTRGYQNVQYAICVSTKVAQCGETIRLSSCSLTYGLARSSLGTRPLLDDLRSTQCLTFKRHSPSLQILPTVTTGLSLGPLQWEMRGKMWLHNFRGRPIPPPSSPPFPTFEARLDPNEAVPTWRPGRLAEDNQRHGIAAREHSVEWNNIQ